MALATVQPGRGRHAPGGCTPPATRTISTRR